MKPHAFVAMPFGSKPGPDGQLIDFNRVYTEYIQPAVEAAGLEVFRADQEQRPAREAHDLRAADPRLVVAERRPRGRRQHRGARVRIERDEPGTVPVPA